MDESDKKAMEEDLTNEQRIKRLTTQFMNAPFKGEYYSFHLKDIGAVLDEAHLLVEENQRLTKELRTARADYLEVAIKYKDVDIANHGLASLLKECEGVLEFAVKLPFPDSDVATQYVMANRKFNALLAKLKKGEG